jgi:hypothetical protein
MMHDFLVIYAILSKFTQQQSLLWPCITIMVHLKGIGEVGPVDWVLIRGSAQVTRRSEILTPYLYPQ